MSLIVASTIQYILAFLVIWLFIPGNSERVILFFKRTSLPDKDSNDYTLTKNSTEWSTDSHFCKRCESTTGHEEYMANICNNCGNMEIQGRYRAYRKIVQNGKWVYQYKYQNDTFKLTDKRL